MIPDTRPDAHAIQMTVYRRMSGERRVALMFEMSEEAREITLAGLRRQHAKLDERAIAHQERARRLGTALADAAWPPRVSLRDFLARLTGALDQAAVPYMVAGSIASTYYRYPRTNQGVDSVVDLDGPHAAVEGSRR